MKYQTDRPIVRADGTITTQPTQQELLDSPHGDLQLLASMGGPFLWGGTTFIPMIDLPQYTEREQVVSLPGIPVVMPHRTKPTTIAPRPAKPQRPSSYERGETMRWTALTVAFAAIFVALGWVAAKHISPICPPEIAQPVYDPATGQPR